MSLRRTTVSAVVALAMVMGAVPAMGHGNGGDSGGKIVWKDIARAAMASGKYHRLDKALKAGYVPFAIPEEAGGTLLSIRGEDITCFDDPTGGMGVHYVRNIDDKLRPTDPEALVYEVRKNGRLRLVALEYLIPADLVDPTDPPRLFGKLMHPHPYLPVYILHVWLWRRNPSGMFADFNPRVRDCPAY